jgi:hypothetical protein
MAAYLKRIPQAPKAGEPIGFNSGQRSRIAAAYGESLSDEIWIKITVATSLYAIAAPAEKTALPINDFLSKLHRLKELAQSIRTDFSSNSDTDTGRTLTGVRKLNAIQRKYFQLPVGTHMYPGASLDLLEHTLNAVEVVCDLVSMELSDPEFAGFTEGWLWDYWICWLTMIVKEHGHPHEASKGSDKEKPGSPISPFARFVDELQKCLPEEYRRHDPTPNAPIRHGLVSAIYRARQGMDVDCKFSDAVDISTINKVLKYSDGSLSC